MALNPYTLNHLYQNGILDYVPTDLMVGTPMGTMMPMNNPYLDMAKQGGLYQNHGTAPDSFHSSYTPAYTPQYHQSASASANSYVGAGSYNYGPVQIGSKSQTGGMATFNGVGVGSYNQNGLGSSIGANGTIGGYNQNGFTSSIGANGAIGAYSNTGGANTFGGFADTQNNIASGVNKTVSFFDRMPKLLLGIIGGTIGTMAIVSAFKHGKKPKTSGNNSSFWSKLNPMNWFRKNK